MIGSWRRSKKLFKQHLKTFPNAKVMRVIGTLFILAPMRGMLCTRYHSFIAIPENSPYLPAAIEEASARKKCKADLKRWILDRPVRKRQI